MAEQQARVFDTAHGLRDTKFRHLKGSLCWTYHEAGDGWDVIDPPP